MLIFLIGFMGCGKSFTGRQLSAALDIPFMDMDTAIERQEGCSISELFETEGEPYFRAREAVFIEELSKTGSVVVATGGGAPCHHNLMEAMNRLGVTIFLDLPRETIVDRLLSGLSHRPLLKGMNRYDLEYFYDRKMEERRPFYEQAHFTVRHQDVEVLVRLLNAFLS